MFLPNELRILLVLTVLLTVPGWFLLTVTGTGRRWTALQRWCLAIGLSIAFLPVMMYFLRLVPGFRMGVNKWLLLLVVLALVAAWNMRKTWRTLFKFDSLEVLVIAVLLATLFTRLWMAYLHPYPAWSDSLHHTLITQLAAEQGRLPNTLEPYAPTPLDMYHLGLYAISSAVMLLAKVPAHSALLWTAQALNGLCGLGVFLVLDRKVGRVGALVGAAVVGLFSFQPAWYINWGRFTQVASQAILLIAWLVTWEAIRSWRRKGQGSFLARLMLSAAAGVLTAAVFLLHFQVAGFYLPLLALVIAWELYCAIRDQRIKITFAGIFITGFFCILFILPALFEAFSAYLTLKNVAAASGEAQSTTYYQFPFDSLFSLGIKPWFMTLTIIAFLFGLVFRKKFIGIMAGWTVLLIIEGFLYLFNIPVLAFTNLGAVLIMLYLPFSMAIGAMAENLVSMFTPSRYPSILKAVIVFIFTAGYLGSFARVGGIEPYRFFMTGTDDLAMQWINANTMPGSVFAINTYFWMDNFPHGTDAGYWIPYFTGRQTTSGTMLWALGPKYYTDQVQSRSEVVRSFEVVPDQQNAQRMCEQGINYVYIGEVGNFAGKGLDANKIGQIPSVDLVFQQGHVYIFDLCRETALH